MTPLVDGLEVPLANGLRAKLGLVVGGLVASGLRRGLGPIRLDVRRSPEALMVEVEYVGGTGVRARSPTGQMIDARDLFVVRRLSDRWGVLPGGHGVWLELRRERSASSRNGA